MPQRIPKLIWRLLTLALGAVFGAIISLAITRGMAGGVIQPFQAQEFLKNYYATAVNPASARQAWQMLTPDFERDSQGGYDGYLKWWKNWHRVVLGEVQPVGGNNQFMVDVTYIGTDNRPHQHGKGIFSLSCVDFLQSYNPLNSTCSVNNIRMSYFGLSTVPTG
jgi:hypothetical protein